jgi:hypothetical protein
VTADRPDPGGPPFFVVAAARSGTTLLRVMLDRHPMLAVPGEGHFIPHLWSTRERYGRSGVVERPEVWLDDLARHPSFRFWDLPIAEVRAELGGRERLGFAEAVDAAYRAYARAHGKPRWADKTPDYIDHLPLLAGLFPNARFVHMLRDGRDVALSTIDLKRFHRHAATCAHFWSRQVGGAMREGEALGPDRYLELRYEDLIDDPERELRRLCAFGDLPFDEALLEHDAHDLEKLPERFRPIHSRLALPPTKGLRDWRSQMPRSEVAEFEAVAGPQLSAAGYALEAGPAGPWTRVRARWRMVGFAARYLRHRARARLRRRTSRPTADAGVPG